MLTPSAVWVKYLGWITAVILYCIFFGYKTWKENYQSKNLNHVDNIHGDYELMVNDGKNNENEDDNKDVVDKAVHKVLLKSTFSLCQEIGDLVNSIIFMIYFEYFSGLTFSSIFGKIHLSVFILKIIFELVDITQNIFHIFYGKTQKARNIVIFGYIKLHFNLFFTLYIIFVSYYKLSNPETFWCSVLFLSNVFKSFYNIQIKMILEMYNNAIEQMYQDYTRSDYAVILVTYSDTNQPKRTSKSSDCCLIKVIKKAYNFLYSKLDDIIIYIFPCLILANCVIYSMLIMGPFWIFCTFIIWFVYVFTVAFCSSCNCQCKLWWIYLSLFFNILANILAGAAILLYQFVYTFIINKYYTLNKWNEIGQHWWYGISNGIIYLLIVFIPLILFGPVNAFCGWYHCQGVYASTWTIDKVYLSLTYVVTFAAPGIIVAVIHPWSFDDCSDGTHWATVAISLGSLLGVSILFCLNCHAAALCNCRTGPNFHDSTGIRRRCHGCMCLLSMTSLIIGCVFCTLYAVDIYSGCNAIDLHTAQCYNVTSNSTYNVSLDTITPLYDAWYFNCTDVTLWFN
eukprot:265670_1